MVVDGFFRALASAEEGSDRWRSAVAGLAIVRLIESILYRDEPTPIYERARDFTAKVPSTGLRALMNSLLDVARPGCLSTTENADLLVQRLMGWGGWLHSNAEYGQAADVFAAVVAVAVDDDEIRIQAAYRRAFALRLDNQLKDAEQAYQHLVELASRAGDERMRLEGKFGLARLVASRGNIPGCAPLIDAVADEAERLGQWEILRKCHMMRAYIAGIRLNPAGVVQHSYLALEGMTDATERLRVFNDMAVALREVGESEAARVLAEHVMQRADSAEPRIAATITRYHLAIDDCDWLMTERIRRAFGLQKMSPSQAADFYLTVSREHADRGDWTAARAMVERVLAIAEAEDLAEHIIRGDEAMLDIREGRVPVRFKFAPKRPTDKNEQRAVAAIAAAVPALCEV